VRSVSPSPMLNFRSNPSFLCWLASSKEGYGQIMAVLLARGTARVFGRVSSKASALAASFSLHRRINTEDPPSQRSPLAG
jgi:hypothetical protein